MVIEDNKDTAKFIKITLQKVGFEVKLAYDGATGLKTLLEFHPSVIILDVNMPCMDGYEVCSEIRKNEIYRNIPIIIFTIEESEKSIVQCLSAGTDIYLSKSIEPDELVLWVKKVLE